jgi:F-type H+-transporting ATPase subunit c
MLNLNNIVRLGLVMVVMAGFIAAPAFAADPSTSTQDAAHAPTAPISLVAIGAGLVTFGGAFGIGMLAKSAMEGIARQPEAGGAIRGAMIVAAALIEGFTFFALIICLLSNK